MENSKVTASKKKRPAPRQDPEAEEVDDESQYSSKKRPRTAAPSKLHSDSQETTAFEDSISLTQMFEESQKPKKMQTVQQVLGEGGKNIKSSSVKLNSANPLFKTLQDSLTIKGLQNIKELAELSVISVWSGKNFNSKTAGDMPVVRLYLSFSTPFNLDVEKSVFKIAGQSESNIQLSQKLTAEICEQMTK